MVLELRPILKKDKDIKEYIRRFGYFLWVVVFMLVIWLIVRFFC